jgi:hypothetical protein
MILAHHMIWAREFAKALSEKGFHILAPEALPLSAGFSRLSVILIVREVLPAWVESESLCGVVEMTCWAADRITSVMSSSKRISIRVVVCRIGYVYRGKEGNGR